MVTDALSSLLVGLDVVRPALTEPGFRNFMVLFAGWVCTTGPHAVTAALVVTGVSGRRHHEAFHRFYSRGTWSPDELGRLIFVRLLAHVSGAVRVVIDDTLAAKKGPQVFGLGCHLDAVRSTKKHKVFAFGHVWVVLAVLIGVPFSNRTWALPVLFRLYRNKKECKKHGGAYFKKTELARQMLDVLAGWAGERKVYVAADSAYCNDTVIGGVASTIHFFGSMRPDAVLTACPPKNRKGKCGRPALRGKPVPKPEQIAASGRYPWETCKLTLYGKRVQVRYKTVVAQWYRACGPRPVRIVIIECTRGNLPFRVFFSTDTKLTPKEILEGYAERWGIEVCFRDLKQSLGFGDSSARKREAVERTAPFVGLSYTLLVLWFIEGASAVGYAVMPVRPWYRHKTGLCFNDVLRAAQHVLARFDVLDPGRDVANLHRIRSHPRKPAQRPIRRAA
jgi:hypothetical protein